jgi:site-specific recombinase XerD
MQNDGTLAGAARLVLADGVSLLRPDEQVFEAMLRGWRDQGLARNLAPATLQARERQVRALQANAGSFPWQWTLQSADEWFADLRAVRHCTRSTLRGYQVGIRGFCDYVTDPAYGWIEECLRRFGTHPVQVITAVNAAVHVSEVESEPVKRPFTRRELHELFSYADEQVAAKQAAGKKGWLTAFRDATLLKTAYAFGLRRTETRMLDASDFGRNPEAPEFGEFGVVHVRHGKARRASPAKRRSVLTVWAWTSEILEQWFEEVRPLFGPDSNPAAWPSERGPRIAATTLDHRLAAYRTALDLDPALDFHSLRRSYVTHLIEDGWDPRFVQDQVGHEHASTTAIYTGVSSDFRIRTLRHALDRIVAGALDTEVTEQEGPA